MVSSYENCGGPFYILGWIAPAVLRPNDSRVGELGLPTTGNIVTKRYRKKKYIYTIG